MPDDWFPPTRSPDGRIEVRYDPSEMRMSLWITPPTVVRMRDGYELVALEVPWSCDRATFPQPDRVALELRWYPQGDRSHEVVIDVEAEQWWFAGRPEETSHPVCLPEALERARTHQVAADAPELIRRGVCPECGAPLRDGLCEQCERRWA